VHRGFSHSLRPNAGWEPDSVHNRFSPLLSNSLKTKSNFTYIYVLSPYRSASTFPLRYRKQPVRNVEGNSRC